MQNRFSFSKIFLAALLALAMTAPVGDAFAKKGKGAAARAASHEGGKKKHNKAAARAQKHGGKAASRAKRHR